MSLLTFERMRLWSGFVLLIVLLVPVAAGCKKSGGSTKAPTGEPLKEPKIRIEGPAGTSFGYSVSYFDGADNLDTSGTAKTIPESGVYSEDLKGGHQGVLVQVIPSGKATVTIILLDGSTEIQRATATGKTETAEVKAGKFPSDRR
jgi:hypothetical protein